VDYFIPNHKLFLRDAEKVRLRRGLLLIAFGTENISSSVHAWSGYEFQRKFEFTCGCAGLRSGLEITLRKIYKCRNRCTKGSACGMGNPLEPAPSYRSAHRAGCPCCRVRCSRNRTRASNRSRRTPNRIPLRFLGNPGIFGCLHILGNTAWTSPTSRAR
jgi:hypothetical protein